MATGRPLLTGTSESDQLARIFRQMGTPTPVMYPGLQELPDYRVRQLISNGSDDCVTRREGRALGIYRWTLAVA